MTNSKTITIAGHTFTIAIVSPLHEAQMDKACGIVNAWYANHRDKPMTHQDALSLASLEIAHMLVKLMDGVEGKDHGGT